MWKVACLLNTTILTSFTVKLKSNQMLRAIENQINVTTIHLLLWKIRLIEALSLIGCQTESEWVQWNSLKIHQKIPCLSGSTFVWKLRDEIWLNIFQRIKRVLLSLLQSQHKSFPQTLKPKTDKLWKERRTLTALTKLSAPINRDPAELSTSYQYT